MDGDSIAARMKRMARYKAFKVSRDDMAALAEDLEMAGWIAWLEWPSRQESPDVYPGHSNAFRWSYVRREMNHAWSEWKYERKYRHPSQIDWSQVERDRSLCSINDFDLTSPTNVEEEVIGRELITKFYAALAGKRQKKARRLFNLMLLNGMPSMVKGDNERLGLGNRGNVDRKRAIRLIAESLGLRAA
jgi:hypothetical protein